MSRKVPNTSTDPRHQQLMQFVEAEEASNGEVGCGQDWSNTLPEFLHRYRLHHPDASLQEALYQSLGETSTDSDYDRILAIINTFSKTEVEKSLDEPLTPAAGQAILERLPEPIRSAIVARAAEIECPVELIIESVF